MNLIFKKIIFTAAFGVLFVFNVCPSIVHKANLNSKVEEMAQKYLGNEGFFYNDTNVWSDYLTGVSLSEWALATYPGSYIDSADIETVTYREMAKVVSNLRTRLFQDFQLDQKTSDVIKQVFMNNGITENDAIRYLRYEFDQKKNEVKNELKRTLNIYGKGYIEYNEAYRIAESILFGFMQKVKNYLYGFNFVQPAASATASSGWLSWLTSLFNNLATQQGTQSNTTVCPVPSAPPAPSVLPVAGAVTTEEKVYDWQLEQAIKEKVASVLGAKGIKVQAIPQKSLAEYYQKIQKMIASLKKIMAEKIRNYVFASEVDHVVRTEIDSVVDSMAISCSICLDGYQAGDKTCKLNCGHVFHEDCLDAALRNKKACPICNATNVFVVERKII